MSTACWHLPRMQDFASFYLLCYANYAMSTKNLENSKFFSFQRLYVNQAPWIYRFEATAFYYILCNAVVEDKATLGSDASATTAAYSIRAVSSLLPSIYDYTGAHNAANPAMYNG
jgi:hypothetical protein